MLSACDGGGGGNPALQTFLFDHLASVPFVHKVASLVVTAHYNTNVNEEISTFPVWSTGNDQAYRIVLADARSKFRQRQHFLTQFTDMLFYSCYKCFSLTTT